MGRQKEGQKGGAELQSTRRNADGWRGGPEEQDGGLYYSVLCDSLLGAA